MRGANGYLSFNTPKDNILYFGELITKSAYKGKTLKTFAKIYCPPRKSKSKNEIKKSKSKLIK